MAEVEKARLAEIRAVVSRVETEEGADIATELYIDGRGDHVMDALELIIKDIQHGMGDIPFEFLIGMVLRARKRRLEVGGESVKVDLSELVTWKAQRGDDVG